MAFCPNCGTTVEDDERFCHACGKEMPQSEGGKSSSEDVPKPTPSSVDVPRAGRRGLIVGVVTAVVVCVITVVVLLVFVKPGQTSTSDQGGQAAPATQTTEDADAKSEEAKDAEPAQESAPDPEAEKKKEEERRASLRAEAEAAGKQVFEGIIHVGNGSDTANTLGTVRELNANGPTVAQQEAQNTYALLQLGDKRSVYVTGYSGDPYTKDYAYIQVGKNRNISAEGDTASQWQEYDGKNVCVAVDSFFISEGVTVVNVPQANVAELLYVVDGETEPVVAEANADYDPTWYSSSESTFETQDFVITIPAEWGDRWKMDGVNVDEKGNVVWRFGRTDPPANGGMPAGGGLIVSDGTEQPTGSFAVLGRAAEGQSSHGKSVWYMVGDPQGFFAINPSEVGATITLK